MVKRRKSINLYLVDGSTRGTIKCTIANWTGFAYKISRQDLENCKKINFLNQSGVYLLFGKSENEINKDTVYIGQAGSRKNGKGLLGVCKSIT